MVGWSRPSSGVAGALALAACLFPAPAAAKAPTRYSIAGGCYSLAPVRTGKSLAIASRQRLQATRLGSYMLFGRKKDFLAATGGSVERAAQPGPDADWRVEPAAAHSFRLSPASARGSVLATRGKKLQLVPRSGSGRSSRFRFARARGCAAFPEAQLDVSGRPARGKTPYGQVRGILDGHMHWMNFEYLGGNFHCGRPWSPYGIPAALPDCSSIEGPNGTAAPVQNFLNYGDPEHPHDTTGWPKLSAWGRTNLTYEGTYYRWLQRVWKSGLRLIVMPVNENRALCELMPSRRNSCDEMDAAHRELHDVKQLQNYVDAQAGGPGKGFFQIVRNPFQARRVINKGKMAVVLEVEISEPFGCYGTAPTCTRSSVNKGLADLYHRGVRSSLLLNKFDNQLTGVRFDSGPVGALINAGNKKSYGSFWDAQTCTGPEHDNTIDNFVPEPGSYFATLLAMIGAPSGTAPTYPPAPHCNTRGLTELGQHAVRRMMSMGMIVNPDHMSQKGVDNTLTIAESHHYSGVISPHGWMDPGDWPRIWKLGGMAFPNSGTAAGFVDAWKAYRPKRTPYSFGWGYGADLGGLATQGAPPGKADDISYPFKSIDGATTVRRQRTGQHVFDYNKDGVAHYGLYADWLDEIQKLGGAKLRRDMLRGPEAYLEMWERSEGVPASTCLSPRARFSGGGLADLRLGATYKSLLERAGQPLVRTRAWSYCVKGRHNRHSAANAVLTPGGRVALVASSARGQSALGIGPGTPARRLHGVAEAIGGGVWTASLAGRTVAYVVRSGVVRTVAVAGPPALASSATLRAYLALVPSRGVAPRPSGVVGAAPASLSPRSVVPLGVEHGSPQFPYAQNTSMLYCGL
jgi:hypothetical protein